MSISQFVFPAENRHQVNYNCISTVFLYTLSLYLLELGGGGRRGNAEELEDVADVSEKRLLALEPDPDVADPAFLRPGIAMLKVWPSLRL